MRILALALLVALSAPAVAQEQQAGNEASTKAAETFQKLIDQCDNVDALTLRARIRLLISRTTPDAAKEAQTLLDQGFAACGKGDMDTAITTLNTALEVADAGTTEVFEGGNDATSAAAAPQATQTAATDDDKGAWWQFWKN